MMTAIGEEFVVNYIAMFGNCRENQEEMMNKMMNTEILERERV